MFLEDSVDYERRVSRFALSLFASGVEDGSFREEESIIGESLE